MECNIYKASDRDFEESKYFNTLEELCQFVDENFGTGKYVRGGIIIFPLADGTYDLTIYDSEME